MTAREIAARLDAKPCGKKWIARCPSHDDRSPSLSIAEGTDGRTLLFCHAGCHLDAVARALGVAVHELFPDGSRRRPQSSSQRRDITAAELRDALMAEMQHYRDAHGIDGALLTKEVNAVRAAVARRFGVVLPPVRQPLWEGGYGRERDPMWPEVFAWAMSVASVELIGVPLDYNETLPPPRAILLRGEEIAAGAMASLEHDARRSERGATA